MSYFAEESLKWWIFCFGSTFPLKSRIQTIQNKCSSFLIINLVLILSLQTHTHTVSSSPVPRVPVCCLWDLCPRLWSWGGAVPWCESFCCCHVRGTSRWCHHMPLLLLRFIYAIEHTVNITRSTSLISYPGVDTHFSFFNLKVFITHAGVNNGCAAVKTC